MDDKNKVTGSVETYDPLENRWRITESKLCLEREGHSAVVTNNKIFVLGGNFRTLTYSAVEIYFVETEQFSIFSPMKMVRTFFSCCSVDNKIYVFGGFVFGTLKATSSVEVFYLGENFWKRGPDLSVDLTGT